MASVCTAPALLSPLFQVSLLFSFLARILCVPCIFWLRQRIVLALDESDVSLFFALGVCGCGTICHWTISSSERNLGRTRFSLSLFSLFFLVLLFDFSLEICCRFVFFTCGDRLLQQCSSVSVGCGQVCEP